MAVLGKLAWEKMLAFPVNIGSVMKKNNDSPSCASPAASRAAEKPKDWSWLDAIVGTMSEDFMKDGREQPAMQERPELDEIF